MTSPGRFDGKVVVVTGGETGIGRAVAQRCGREGASVTVAGIDAGNVKQTVADLEAEGIKALGVVTDVREEDSVEDALAQTVAAFGKVDAVHANAGIAGIRQDSVGLPVEDWNQVIAVNLTGAFFTLRAGARRMIAQGTGGCLLATGSSTALRPGFGIPAYIAAKAGVHILVKSLALEWAPHGIRVNGIAPGLTETPLTLSREGHIERGLKVVALGRTMQPDEIAGLAAYVMSDEAAGMTGSMLSYDGGRTAD